MPLGKILPTLGPEPLGDEFTTEWLTDSFAKRNAPVKALLLEQSIAAGVGNIYADEALFLSGIRPDRPASGLSADEVVRLRQGIIDCINAGFAVYDRVRDLRWPEPPEPMGTWSHPRDASTPCPNCDGGMELHPHPRPDDVVLRQLPGVDVACAPNPSAEYIGVSAGFHLRISKSSSYSQNQQPVRFQYGIPNSQTSCRLIRCKTIMRLKRLIRQQISYNFPIVSRDPSCAVLRV